MQWSLDSSLGAAFSLVLELFQLQPKTLLPSPMMAFDLQPALMLEGKIEDVTSFLELASLLAPDKDVLPIPTRTNAFSLL